MYAISLSSVNLIFKPRKRWHIKDLFVQPRHAENDGETVGAIHVLKDINLEIASGERVGIIGHNGAGKSTLLRIISGIYHPTSGTIERCGSLVSLFELSTGFDMEATGWENIRIRGILLGMSLSEVNEKIKEIAEFTGLGHHLTRPMKYYSSGMCLRVAFSVSTAINPDILLLDEIVAAGDLDFAVKAKARMDSLIAESKILVSVSHSLESIQETCNRCVYISHGRIIQDGAPQEVIQAYMKSGDRI